MTFLNHKTNLLKLLATISMVAAVIGFQANAAAAAPLGRSLVELESHIKWSAVDNAWKNLRPKWVAKTAACDDPKCVAAQLLELESNVQWKAVDAAWAKKRMAWVSACKAATTHPEAANLLLEFEENVRWQAVDENWKARRDGWIAGIKGG